MWHKGVIININRTNKTNLPDIYEGSTNEEPQHIGSCPFHCQYQHVVGLKLEDFDNFQKYEDLVVEKIFKIYYLKKS